MKGSAQLLSSVETFPLQRKIILYTNHKLEFFALKWAVVDRLHDYLNSVQFEVRIPAMSVRALCKVISVEKRAGCVSYPSVVHQIGAHMSAVPKPYCQTIALVADHLPELSSSEIQVAQRNDARPERSVGSCLS